MDDVIALRLGFFLGSFALIALMEKAAPRRPPTTSKMRRWAVNYGFNLPWWDRLLGTYKDQPERGHGGMTIGLSQFRDPNELTFPRRLILPLIGEPGCVPNVVLT